MLRKSNPPLKGCTKKSLSLQICYLNYLTLLNVSFFTTEAPANFQSVIMKFGSSREGFHMQYFLPRTLCSENPINTSWSECPSEPLQGHRSRGKSHRRRQRLSLGPSPPHTQCDLRQRPKASISSRKIKKWCLICSGGTECLSVSNVWKNLPTRLLHTTVRLLILSFHMVENWLIQEQVLKRLKPILFVSA